MFNTSAAVQKTGAKQLGNKTESQSVGSGSEWLMKEPEVDRVKLKDEKHVQMKLWIISYELIQDSEGSIFKLCHTVQVLLFLHH